MDISMKLSIYTKSDCTYCSKAKVWLKKNGFRYTEVSLDDEIQRKEFYHKYQVSSVPQVFISDRRIGGYSDLETGLDLFRFNQTYKPFLFPWAVDLTIVHEKIHWVEGELDLTEDVAEWKRGIITPVEKEYITNILRLFTQSDVAVGQNYCDQFIPIFKNNEVRNMLLSFACREGTHQRGYALLNDTLGLPESEYSVFLEYQELSEKVDFMMGSNVSTIDGLLLSLAKTVFNEGVSLFSSFAMLLNFQRFGKMKGMGKVVEWSTRDESKHVEGGAALFITVGKLYGVPDHVKRKIYEMARKAAELEYKFIELAYGGIGTLNDLKEEDMKLYVQYLVDRRLLQLGLKPIFGIKDNPLPWIQWLLIGADHTNFFENRVTEYEVAGLTGKWSDVY